MTIGRHFDVARLDVPMNNGRLARVQISQRVAHCRADHDRVIFADRTHAFHALTQILAINKIHDEILSLIADHKMIRHARQIGMAQIRQNHRFQPELTRVFVRGEKILFEGYLHAEIFIHGAINRPHAALTKNFNNAITFM